MGASQDRKLSCQLTGAPVFPNGTPRVVGCLFSLDQSSHAMMEVQLPLRIPGGSTVAAGRENLGESEEA